MRKVGGLHCNADSSNNSKGDWTKRSRKKRGRGASCLDCSDSGKGGSEGGESSSLVDSCYSNSVAAEGREKREYRHLKKKQHLCSVCVKAAGACVRKSSQI